MSVLDLATVGEGSRPARALAATTTLAAAAEHLVYRRFWVSQHHAMAPVTSSAPAVRIAGLAAATTSLWVGSGGVTLPSHAPLVVAEQFATLETLRPGREDLGVGRAPGSDPATARALRRAADLSDDTFPHDVVERLATSPRVRPPIPLQPRALAARRRSGSSTRPSITPSWPRRSDTSSFSPTTSRPVTSTRPSPVIARAFGPRRNSTRLGQGSECRWCAPWTTTPPTPLPVQVRASSFSALPAAPVSSRARRVPPPTATR